MIEALLHFFAVFFGAGAVLLLGLAFKWPGRTYCKNLFRAGDKTLAAFLGFSGYATLSAECGRLAATGGPTWPARVLDFFFGKGHCVGAALNEKLLPEPR